MLGPVIEWFGGGLFALLAWAALAEFAAALLWVIMIVLSAHGGNNMPMRTTTNRATGEKRTGALTWLLAFSAVLCSLPVGIMAWKLLQATLVAALEVVTWVVGHWWLFALAGLALAALALYRRRAPLQAWLAARRQPVEPEPLAPLPHNPMPTGPVQRRIPFADSPQPPASPPNWSQLPDTAWQRPADSEHV